MLLFDCKLLQLELFTSISKLKSFYFQVFFFHGLLVCGPDPRGLIFTTVSIIVSDWVFSVYIGGDLPNHSTLIVAFSFILTIVVSIVQINQKKPSKKNPRLKYE